MAHSEKVKPPAAYSNVQIALHWLIAALIALQIIVNDDIERSFDSRMDMQESSVGFLTYLHITTGITIFWLAIIRLIVRLRHGAPASGAGVPKIITVAADLAHFALYGTLLAMPLMGALAWFGYDETAAEFHEFGSIILILLLVAHVGGAFFEEFILGHPSIRRMLGTSPRN